MFPLFEKARANCDVPSSLKKSNAFPVANRACYCDEIIDKWLARRGMFWIRSTRAAGGKKKEGCRGEWTMSLDRAVHWGGAEGWTPSNINSINAITSFFYALACGNGCSPLSCCKVLSCLCIRWGPPPHLPLLPHPPTTPPESCWCLCLVCLHRLVPLDRVSHKWHGYGVCFGKSHSGAVGV